MPPMQLASVRGAQKATECFRLGAKGKADADLVPTLPDCIGEDNCLESLALRRSLREWDLTGLMPSAGLCRVVPGKLIAGAVGRGCGGRPSLLFSA
jgi:hypothetical protein